MMKRFFVCFLVCMLALTSACAETTVTRQGLMLGEGYVYYPQVEGMEDATVQEKVNAALRTSTGAETLLTRLALTMQSAAPLQVDFTHQLMGDVLSVTVLATGPVENDRATQVWYTANIDLTTGEAITFEDIFVDAEAARLALEEQLEWGIAPLLSAHLRNSQLTPLPETFGISEMGLTLYYPMEQLSTLSDRAGTVSFRWAEMLEYLKLGEGTILHRIGAERMVTLDESSAEAIRTAVESGQLPGIPVKLGGSVQEAVDAYRLLMDPDLYENGRMMQLEDGAFRGVYLLTDSLTDSWEQSVIQGIRVDQVNLYGLMTDVTTQAEWRSVLGEPDATVEVDDVKAESNRILPGYSDYYNYDGVQLRLHANDDGDLVSLFISIR
ncbi:MAG: hypothetical protein IJX84_08955 [Clostridia bacterium]|nr:hypothetical protein [Clostridia bacterium]